MRIFYSLLIVFILFSCNSQLKNSGNWKLIYKNDSQGNTLYGAKEDLLNAVRNGYPIRIGWGRRSRVDSTITIEHTVDAAFLTILSGKEVFAQIHRIVGQRPSIENDSIKIHFREKNLWLKMAGTNGFSTGIMYDYVNDSLVSFGRDSYTTTSWFTYSNEALKNSKVLYTD